MVDEDTVRKFAGIVGVGRIYLIKRPGKDLFSWQTTKGAEFEEIVTALGPWLSERRRERAAELIGLSELPKGKPWGSRKKEVVP